MNILAAEGYGWTIFWIALLVILLILMIVMFNFIGLYIRAMVSGAHVTFADLGLDVRLRTLTVEASCVAHGNFEREWVGCLGEFLPDEIACDLHGPDGHACGLSSKVRSAEIH